MQGPSFSKPMQIRRIRRYCRVSKVFDDNHLRYVRECQDKHRGFFWKVTGNGCFTTIGDSLVKNIRSLKYTDVQAFLGVNACAGVSGGKCFRTEEKATG